MKKISKRKKPHDGLSKIQRKDENNRSHVSCNEPSKRARTRRSGICIPINDDDSPSNHILSHLSLQALPLSGPEKISHLDLLLSTHPIFKALPHYCRVRVLSEMVSRRLEEGTTLFRAGPMDDNFYVIEQGTIRLTNTLENAKTIGPGGFLGELSLIQPAGKEVKAIVMSKYVNLWTINGGLFRYIKAQAQREMYDLLTQIYKKFLSEESDIELCLDASQIIDLKQNQQLAVSILEKNVCLVESGCVRVQCMTNRGDSKDLLQPSLVSDSDNIDMWTVQPYHFVNVNFRSSLKQQQSKSLHHIEEKIDSDIPMVNPYLVLSVTCITPACRIIALKTDEITGGSTIRKLFRAVE